MKKVLWQEMRRTEFEEAVKEGAVVVVPVGSLEQHGDHLPVYTDTGCCLAIAKGAAEAVADFPVLVLPPLWSGYSPHHMGYPGTITLKFHTFVEVLTQIAESVHAHGFRKILFLNGHGGNSAVIAALRTKLATESGITAVGYTYWDLPGLGEEMKAACETDKGFIGHAAEIETSLQLYLQPEAVDPGAALWAPGVWGDPSRATRSKGERIYRAAVEALARVLREYHSGGLEERFTWRREIA